MEKVEVLRLEVLKKLQTEDVSVLKRNVFITGFYENLEKFYDQDKESYSKVSDRKKTDFKAKLKTCFASESFKKMFDKFNLEGHSLNSSIEGLISSEKAISRFLKSEKTNAVTHDFFSVFIGYKGFNDFIVNHKISDSLDYLKIEVVEKTLDAIIPFEDKIESDFTDIDFNYLKENQVLYCETLIDAFELGLNLFFINFLNSLQDEEGIEVDYFEMFASFLEIWNLNEVFSLENLAYYTKRLKIDNDLNDISFDIEEVQVLFDIGNIIAHRICNRIMVEIDGDTEELDRIRFDLDSELLAISAWLDLEYIYVETIGSNQNIDPSCFLKFISVLKGAVRQRYSIKNKFEEKLGNIIATVHLYGFEAKFHEIIHLDVKTHTNQLDSFISNLIKSKGINIVFYSNFKESLDYTSIKQKINCTSLKDYFRLGELIAQDFISHLVFSSNCSFKSLEEFEQLQKKRKIDEIKFQFILLNLSEIYDQYMPIQYFEGGKCLLKGNYDLFLIKTLKKIRNIR